MKMNSLYCIIIRGHRNSEIYDDKTQLKLSNYHDVLTALFN